MKILRYMIAALFFVVSVSFSKGPLPNAILKKGALLERNIKLKVVYKISVKGRVSNLRLKMLLPKDVKNRQVINAIDYSVYPDSVYNKYNNTYALFKLNDVEKDLKIIVTEDITIYQAIAEKNEDAKDSTLIQYLEAEKNIESDDSTIQTLAATLKQKTDIETIMKTYFYVKEHITYKLKKDIGAAAVLESGVGKCMDFSDLFVALARANKIPAKSMFGLTLEEDEIGYHAWPEAYLKKQGWVQFDPTTEHTQIRQEGNNYKMSIKNKYIILAQGRNEPELRLSRFHYSWRGQAGSEVRIKESEEVLSDTSF